MSSVGAIARRRLPLRPKPYTDTHGSTSSWCDRHQKGEVIVSPKEAAQKHALQSIEHGKAVEEVGKRLLEDDLMKPEIGQSIEASGKTIQKKSQSSLELAQQLTDNGLTEVFAESIQAHIDATQTHIDSTKEFQRGLQAHLDRIK